MSELSIEQVREIGLAAARDLGDIDVDGNDVEVRTFLDPGDEPAYELSFRFDYASHANDATRIYTRLHRIVRDALVARGDENYPMIRLVDRTDWQHRFGA